MKALIAFAALTAALVPSESGHEFIDRLHRYYVSQFENLEMTERGMFGTSRVEASEIRSHMRTGGDPGYSDKNWANGVTIYGNHGKTLTASASHRYSRLPGNGSVSLPTLKNQTEVFAAALKEFRKKASNNCYAVSSPSGLIEVRPIRMTSEKCLNCHRGLKLNEPVAFIVYAIAPIPKR